MALVGGKHADRACAAKGCQRWARPNGFFCSDACRARTWKENHPEYQSPPSPKQRQIAAERAKTHAGGLQVSVGRMLEVLQGEPFYMTESWARRLVGRALSDRQRERFEADENVVEIPGQLGLDEVAA